MEEQSELLIELRKTNKLLLHIALESQEPKDRMLFLHRFGLNSADIGELVGMKADAVRKAIQRSKQGVKNGTAS